MNAPQKFGLGMVIVILLGGLCYAISVDRAAEAARKRREVLEKSGELEKRRLADERKKKEQELLEALQKETGDQGHEKNAGTAKSEKKSKFVANVTLHDIGDVAPFSEITHRFLVRNEGDGPLTLSIAKSSCKCTIGKMDKGVVLPNEETEIELVFKSEQKMGDFVHGVDLKTNDPDRPFVQLGLVGRVRLEYWADPSPVFFTNLGPVEARDQNVLLTSGVYDSFEIVSINSSEPGITCAYEPMSAEEIEREKVLSGYRLKVTYGEEAKGSVKGMLFLSLLGKGQTAPKELKLPVEGTRSGILSITGGDLIDETGAITIGNVTYGQGYKVGFTAKARGTKKSLAVKEMKVEPPFLKVTLEPNSKTGDVEKTGLHVLKIEIPEDAPEGNYQGKFSGKIEIVFEDEQYGSITLKPSFAIVAEKND